MTVRHTGGMLRRRDPRYRRAGDQGSRRPADGQSSSGGRDGPTNRPRWRAPACIGNRCSTPSRAASPVCWSTRRTSAGARSNDGSADCAWIAQLLEHGLLRGSFVPPAPSSGTAGPHAASQGADPSRTRAVNRLHKSRGDPPRLYQRLCYVSTASSAEAVWRL